jgi:hypothetical protein
VAEVFPPETCQELLPCDDSDDNELLPKIDYFRITMGWRKARRIPDLWGAGLGKSAKRSGADRVARSAIPFMGSRDAASESAGFAR